MSTRRSCAETRAEAEFRGEHFPVAASPVTDEERPAVWERFVEAYAGFETRQAGVRRQIALVRLRRAR